MGRRRSQRPERASSAYVALCAMACVAKLGLVLFGLLGSATLATADTPVHCLLEQMYGECKSPYCWVLIPCSRSIIATPRALGSRRCTKAGCAAGRLWAQGRSICPRRW